MKIKSAISLFTVLCVISLVAVACNMSGTPPLVPPTAQPNPSVSIGIYYPNNGSIYSTGESISLNAVIKVVVEQLQISEASFLVNGTSVAATTEPVPNDPSATSNGTWTASDPGEYYIQAKVMLSDGSFAISEPYRICVMPIGVVIPTDWGGGGGYLGPCPLATPVSNRTSTGIVAINAVAAPGVIPFSRICAAPNTPVTFIANVDDPQDLVALVGVLILRPDNRATLSSYLNWTTTRPVNQKEYRGTIQLPSDFLDGVDRVNWRIFAWGRDGQQLQMTLDVISIQPIECSQQHLENSPSATPAPLKISPSETPTSTAVVPPTFTFKINAFCRKGPDMTFSDVTAVTAGETVDILNVSEDGFWYFIYWKKFDAKCWVATGTGEVNGDVTGIKVLVGPPLPAPKPAEPVAPKPVLPPACTSYSDASSCTTHGCSWDKPTNTCK